MKHALPIAFVLFLLPAFIPTQASAQDTPAPVLMRVLEVDVIPSKAADYEEAVKELFALYEKHGMSSPINAGVNGFHYGYLSIHGDLNGLQRSQEESAALAEKEGRNFQRLRAAIAGASIRETSWDVEYRPDLSYTPENPRLQPDQVGATHFFYYHLPREGLAAAEEHAKAAIELWGKKGITTGFAFYSAVTGANLPLVVVGVQGRNTADVYAELANITEKLGEEGQKFNAALFEDVREFHVADFTARPDLSYAP